MKLVRVLTAVAFAVSTTAAMADDKTVQGAQPTPQSAPTFSQWMHDYSKAHNGMVSRDAYLDEMGRRWDAADARKQGMSVEQINRAYGWQPDPVTGLVTAPGYTGPKNVKP